MNCSIDFHTRIRCVRGYEGGRKKLDRLNLREHRFCLSVDERDDSESLQNEGKDEQNLRALG